MKNGYCPVGIQSELFKAKNTLHNIKTYRPKLSSIIKRHNIFPLFFIVRTWQINFVSQLLKQYFQNASCLNFENKLNLTIIIISNKRSSMLFQNHLCAYDLRCL